MSSNNYIGSVNFEYPLVVLTDVPPMRGRVQRCLGGELVVVTIPYRDKSYEAMTIDVAFEWATSYQIRWLRTWWTYAAKLSFKADYVTGRAILDPKQGIYDVKHVFGDGISMQDMAGTASDYFNGKIKLQVLTGYIWS